MQMEFQLRREQLFKNMDDNSIALIPGNKLKTRNEDNDYKFYQDHNFLYLTNFDEDNAIAVIIKSQNIMKFYLFCKKREIAKEIWTGEIIGQERAIAEYGADDAFVSDEEVLNKKMSKFLKDRNKIYYPFKHDCLSKSKITEWLNKYEHKYSEENFVDIIPILAKERLKKSEAEILFMREASRISALAHCDIMRKCKSEMNEREIEGIFFKSCTKRGSSEYAYPVIAASGNNACTLHYIKNNCKLKDGDLLLVDAGCEYEHYAADITRTMPISGKFSQPQRDVYEIVLSAQKAGIAALKTGVTRKIIEDIVVFELLKGLHQLGILKEEVEKIITSDMIGEINGDILNKIKKYYPHGHGHYIGLDVHDTNYFYKQNIMFDVGTCVTVEPGLYFPPDDEDIPEQYRGIGIRIEDTCLITEDGCEILSIDVPKEIIEVEKMMEKVPQASSLPVFTAQRIPRNNNQIERNLGVRINYAV